MNIKKGDTAIIIAGKDKGKKAKVIDTFKETGRVLLEGLNMYKKSERPRQQGKKGQVVDRAMPINASNVQPFCAKCKKGARVSKEVGKKGERVRVCSKCKSKLE